MLSLTKLFVCQKNEAECFIDHPPFLHFLIDALPSYDARAHYVLDFHVISEKTELNMSVSFLFSDALMPFFIGFILDSWS